MNNLTIEQQQKIAEWAGYAPYNYAAGDIGCAFGQKNVYEIVGGILRVDYNGTWVRLISDFNLLKQLEAKMISELGFTVIQKEVLFKDGKEVDVTYSGGNDSDPKWQLLRILLTGSSTLDAIWKHVEGKR
jgi:hypothetical protein